VTDRLLHEIEHSRSLAPHAEKTWGWSSPAGQLRAERRAQLLAAHAELGPGKKALEIGCGTGLFTEKLAASGANLTAVDLSEELLAQARERRIALATITRADAHHLSFSDASFDAVIGSSILHHLDMPQALREAYRVLKPGGKIAFAEPNMLNPQILVQKNRLAQAPARRFAR
jgi:ubiquinone/menaquinone biosynthesis C-methylase UbiE